MADVAALAEGLIKHDGACRGDVEGTDAAGHGNAQQMVARAADEVVQPGAFAAEDEDAVAGEVKLVVIFGSPLVEADNPKILALEFFQGADEVDDAGNAQVLGGSRAGLDGYGAERGGTTLGKYHAIDARAIGHTQQGAKILRVFDAVQSEDEAMGGRGARGEQVLNRKELQGANHGDDALVGGGFGQQGQLFTPLLPHADAALATEGNEALQAHIVPLAGYDHVVKPPLSRLERFLDRMHAIQNFHER
jgi:hypothetical protein